MNQRGTNSGDNTLTTGKPDQDMDTMITELVPTTLPFQSCYNNDANFKIMLKQFWPYIQDYITKHPGHHHTNQWVTWMTKGLNVNSDLAYVKKLFGCDSLDQLFLFFHDSSAINSDFELEWDHKINYRHSIGPKAFAVTPARNHKDNANIFNSPESFHNTVSIDPKDINFCIMHSKLFDLITQWIRTTSSTDFNHHAQWHEWLWKGLKSTNTLKGLRRIMGINDLQE